MTQSGEHYYYSYDGLGSTAEITLGSGGIANQYAYLPFGTVLSETDDTFINPFTFVGAQGVMQETDDLYFMRARYYSPSLGRFLQRDPIGLIGGDVNLYGYTANSPLTRIDPTGLNWLVGTLTGIATGVATGDSESSWGDRVGGAIVGSVPGGNTLNTMTQDGVYEGHKSAFEAIQRTRKTGYYRDWDKFGLGEEMNGSGQDTEVVGSADPNQKLGPNGFGPEGFIRSDQLFSYRIDFENDAEATAPAQLLMSSILYRTR